MFNNDKAMKIMKLSKILLTALTALAAVGCYNKFEMPKEITAEERSSEYIEAKLEAEGYEFKTILEIKDMFGNIQETGSVSKTPAVHKQFVSEFTDNKANEIEGDYYIKGKVLTSDEQGNIYKSLFIWDGTAAIELKLTNGLFMEYPCDLENLKTVMVYVKLTGLYIGNYRMMLSIGDIPTESLSAWGTYNSYANSNINTVEKMHKHVLLGEVVNLNVGTDPDDPNVDVLELDDSSYKSIRPGSNYDTKYMLSSQGPAKYLGRLIRFKGIKVTYKGVEDENGNEYQKILSGTYNQIYPAWICTSGLYDVPNADSNPAQVVNEPWYRLAYSVDGVSLYGQLCVSFPSAENAQYLSEPGVYIVRTSGYSKFAGRTVPRHGAIGTITGIYSIYTGSGSYSSFTGDKNDQATFQIAASRIQDFDFAEEDFLTEEEADALTPDISRTLPRQLSEDDEMSSGD